MKQPETIALWHKERRINAMVPPLFDLSLSRSRIPSSIAGEIEARRLASNLPFSSATALTRCSRTLLPSCGLRLAAWLCGGLSLLGLGCFTAGAASSRLGCPSSFAKAGGHAAPGSVGVYSAAIASPSAEPRRLGGLFGVLSASSGELHLFHVERKPLSFSTFVQCHDGDAGDGDGSSRAQNTKQRFHGESHSLDVVVKRMLTSFSGFSAGSTEMAVSTGPLPR